jgi:hypothetical protein
VLSTTTCQIEMNFEGGSSMGMMAKLNAHKPTARRGITGWNHILLAPTATNLKLIFRLRRMVVCSKYSYSRYSS